MENGEIINITEVKANNLKITQKFNKIRYEKGLRLYEALRIEIKNVLKYETEKYKIQAIVNESSYSSNVTLMIEENTVKKATCECIEYKMDNICKHIYGVVKEVENPHKSSEIQEQIQKRKEEDEKRNRILEEQKRKEEERKKIIEDRIKKQQFLQQYIQKYNSGIQLIDKFSETKKQQKPMNLRGLYNEIISNKNSLKQENTTNIKLEYFVKIENFNEFNVYFKVGNQRMYILKSLWDFYEAYKKQEVLVYGKSLSFVPKRENFEEKSREIFDFIINHIEKVEESMKYISFMNYYCFGKNITLEGREIEEFFKMNNNKDWC